MDMDANRTLGLQLSYPSGYSSHSDKANGVVLNIIDQTSRVRVAEIELTAAQLLDLLATRNIDVEAWVPSTSVLARVGKELRTLSLPIPDVTDRDDADAALAAAWALPFPAPWNESSDLAVDVHYSRSGWSARYRCWLDSTPTP